MQGNILHIIMATWSHRLFTERLFPRPEWNLEISVSGHRVRSLRERNHRFPNETWKAKTQAYNICCICFWDVAILVKHNCIASICVIAFYLMNPICTSKLIQEEIHNNWQVTTIIGKWCPFYYVCTCTQLTSQGLMVKPSIKKIHILKSEVHLKRLINSGVRTSQQSPMWASEWLYRIKFENCRSL